MKTFKKNIINIYGKQGKEWLERLPTITAALAKKYGLNDLTPVSNMSFNYVAMGYRNAQPIILKLGLNSKALTNEVLCLKAFSQHGGAEVLASADRMIIMEQAISGVSIKEYFPNKDDDAIKILCATINNLHCATIPKNHHFHSVQFLLKTLDNNLDIPTEILTKAQHLRDNLLATTDKTVLLHGDLHHDNILKHGDNWLVIDPKGFIGDPAFDTCAFISNPSPQLLAQTSCQQIIHHRIRLCAQLLAIPAQRIRDWHYVKVVLCWAWCLEDNLKPDYFAHLIKIIDNIII